MMEALEFEGMMEDLREVAVGAMLIRGRGFIGGWLSAMDTLEGPSFEFRVACERTLSVVLRSMRIRPIQGRGRSPVAVEVQT